MRITITAAALLLAATIAPAPVVAEQPTCDPNPLTQGHPAWMKMPSAAVDLRAPTPASATNPLMLNLGQLLPASTPALPAEATRVNPLTNRP